MVLPINPFNLTNNTNPFNLQPTTPITSTAPGPIYSGPNQNSSWGGIGLPPPPPTQTIIPPKTTITPPKTTITPPKIQLSSSSPQSSLIAPKPLITATQQNVSIQDRGPGQYYNPITKQGMSSLKDPGIGYVKQTYEQAQSGSFNTLLPARDYFNLSGTPNYFSPTASPISNFTKPSSVSLLTPTKPIQSGMITSGPNQNVSMAPSMKTTIQQTSFGTLTKPAVPSTLTITERPQTSTLTPPLDFSKFSTQLQVAGAEKTMSDLTKFKNVDQTIILPPQPTPERLKDAITILGQKSVQGQEKFYGPAGQELLKKTTEGTQNAMALDNQYRAATELTDADKIAIKEIVKTTLNDYYDNNSVISQNSFNIYKKYADTLDLSGIAGTSDVTLQNFNKNIILPKDKPKDLTQLVDTIAGPYTPPKPKPENAIQAVSMGGEDWARGIQNMDFTNVINQGEKNYTALAGPGVGQVAKAIASPIAGIVQLGGSVVGSTIMFGHDLLGKDEVPQTTIPISKVVETPNMKDITITENKARIDALEKWQTVADPVIKSTTAKRDAIIDPKLDAALTTYSTNFAPKFADIDFKYSAFARETGKDKDGNPIISYEFPTAKIQNEYLTDRSNIKNDFAKTTGYNLEDVAKYSETKKTELDKIYGEGSDWKKITTDSTLFREETSADGTKLMVFIPFEKTMELNKQKDAAYLKDMEEITYTPSRDINKVEDIALRDTFRMYATKTPGNIDTTPLISLDEYKISSDFYKQNKMSPYGAKIKYDIENPLIQLNYNPKTGLPKQIPIGVQDAFLIGGDTTTVAAGKGIWNLGESYLQANRDAKGYANQQDFSKSLLPGYDKSIEIAPSNIMSLTPPFLLADVATGGKASQTFTGAGDYLTGGGFSKPIPIEAGARWLGTGLSQVLPTTGEIVAEKYARGYARDLDKAYGQMGTFEVLQEGEIQAAGQTGRVVGTFAPYVAGMLVGGPLGGAITTGAAVLGAAEAKDSNELLGSLATGAVFGVAGAGIKGLGLYTKGSQLAAASGEIAKASKLTGVSKVLTAVNTVAMPAYYTAMTGMEGLKSIEMVRKDPTLEKEAEEIDRSLRVAYAGATLGSMAARVPGNILENSLGYYTVSKFPKSAQFIDPYRSVKGMSAGENIMRMIANDGKNGMKYSTLSNYLGDKVRMFLFDGTGPALAKDAKWLKQNGLTEVSAKEYFAHGGKVKGQQGIFEKQPTGAEANRAKNGMIDTYFGKQNIEGMAFFKEAKTGEYLAIAYGSYLGTGTPAYVAQKAGKGQPQQDTRSLLDVLSKKDIGYDLATNRPITAGKSLTTDLLSYVQRKGQSTFKADPLTLTKLKSMFDTEPQSVVLARGNMIDMSIKANRPIQGELVKDYISRINSNPENAGKFFQTENFGKNAKGQDIVLKAWDGKRFQGYNETAVQLGSSGVDLTTGKYVLGSSYKVIPGSEKLLIIRNPSNILGQYRASPDPYTNTITEMKDIFTVEGGGKKAVVVESKPYTTAKAQKGDLFSLLKSQASTSTSGMKTGVKGAVIETGATILAGGKNIVTGGKNLIIGTENLANKAVALGQNIAESKVTFYPQNITKDIAIGIGNIVQPTTLGAKIVRATDIIGITSTPIPTILKPVVITPTTWEEIGKIKGKQFVENMQAMNAKIDAAAKEVADIAALKTKISTSPSVKLTPAETKLMPKLIAEDMAFNKGELLTVAQRNQLIQNTMDKLKLFERTGELNLTPGESKAVEEFLGKTEARISELNTGMRPRTDLFGKLLQTNIASNLLQTDLANKLLNKTPVETPPTQQAIKDAIKKLQTFEKTGELSLTPLEGKTVDYFLAGKNLEFGSTAPTTLLQKLLSPNTIAGRSVRQQLRIDTSNKLKSEASLNKFTQGELNTLDYFIKKDTSRATQLETGMRPRTDIAGRLLQTGVASKILETDFVTKMLGKPVSEAPPTAQAIKDTIKKLEIFDKTGKLNLTAVEGKTVDYFLAGKNLEALTPTTPTTFLQKLLSPDTVAGRSIRKQLRIDTSNKLKEGAPLSEFTQGEINTLEFFNKSDAKNLQKAQAAEAQAVKMSRAAEAQARAAGLSPELIAQASANAYVKGGTALNPSATTEIRQAARALITDATGKKILVVQDAKTGTWGLPGGGVRPGESPQYAAFRETFAETGLAPLLTKSNMPDILGGQFRGSPRTKVASIQSRNLIQNQDILFTGKATGEINITRPGEIAAAKWVTPNEFLANWQTGGRTAQTIVARELGYTSNIFNLNPIQRVIPTTIKNTPKTDNISSVISAQKSISIPIRVSSAPKDMVSDIVSQLKISESKVPQEKLNSYKMQEDVIKQLDIPSSVKLTQSQKSMVDDIWSQQSIVSEKSSTISEPISSVISSSRISSSPSSSPSLFSQSAPLSNPFGGNYTAPQVGGPSGKKGKDQKTKKTKRLIQVKSSLFRKFAFGEKDFTVDADKLGAFQKTIAQRGSFFGYDVIPTQQQIQREEQKLWESQNEAIPFKGKEKTFLDIKV